MAATRVRVRATGPPECNLFCQRATLDLDFLNRAKTHREPPACSFGSQRPALPCSAALVLSYVVDATDPGKESFDRHRMHSAYRRAYLATEWISLRPLIEITPASLPGHDPTQRLD